MNTIQKTEIGETMCVRPTRIYVTGKASLTPREVPCRKCWACTKNRVSALVGKALMEQETMEWSYMLNLTYDDKRLSSHPWGDNAKKYVCKADFQHFMRNVRSQMRSQDRANRVNIGSNARYLVAGEYGEKKGRSHFHVLLMGTGMPPPIPKLNKDFQYMDAWPWGFTFAEAVQGEKSIRYIAKYLNKGVVDRERQKNRPTAQEWVSYSKFPPLGAEYVKKLAQMQAQSEIMPYDLRYRPKSGNPDHNYSLGGKLEEIFFDELYEQWPDMVTKPCHEWIYNARLRWKRKKALDCWKSFSLDQRDLILNEGLRLRYRVNVYVEPDRQEDCDWDILWQSAEVARIEQQPPLLEGQLSNELREFYNKLNLRHKVPKRKQP
jgi:hypothetical protein